MVPAVGWPWQSRRALVACLSVCLQLQPTCGSVAEAAAGKHAGQHLMRSYRRTSHSVAMVVPEPEGVEELDSWFRSRHGNLKADHWFTAVGKSLEEENSQPHLPWWFLVAVPVSRGGGDDTAKGLPWDLLVEKFRHRMSEEDKATLIAGLSRKRGSSDDFGIDDPKLQTVRMGKTASGSGEVYFRAVPQGRCDDRTRPPRASFLPRVLPPVAEGRCVLELCGLGETTDYRLILFNISDAARPPEDPPDPLAEATAKTAARPHGIVIFKILMGIACVLAMVLAIARQLREDLVKVQQPTNYSQIATLQEGVGGFHQVKVRNLFIKILRGMLWAMTMFLPIVGPFGLILASDIVIGSRLARVKRSREEYTASDDEYRMGKLWQLIKDVWNLLINIVIIPFNMYTVQILWATYLHTWYGSFGVDLFRDSSYTDVQKYGNQWEEVSGLELGGWVPGIVLSTMLLALELQNDNISTMLQTHRKRAETHLNALAKGRELWLKLCKMDSLLFGRTEDIQDLLPTRLRRLCLAVVFSLIPHAWMCLRHGVPVVGSPMLWYTVVYVVNIAGVSTRFLALSDKIHLRYRNNCAELATFQALSWQEDLSTAIYDPFATRNHAVVASRRKLRENIPRIACLKLEEPEDSKVWWHLRELVFIQIKDGRILMEMMVLMSIWMAVLLGVSSLVVLRSLQEMTAITIVTALVMVVLLRFTYIALALARDINSMYLEHTSLLHNIVGEMNMPLRPSMPLDSHLQQERFLLQVATLIEKQPPPETVASFAVTPQLFSFVVGVLGILTAISLYNLANGILGTKS